MKNRADLVDNKNTILDHLAKRLLMETMSKTILLCGQDDVLSSYVEHFLTTQKGWRVVHISINQDRETLIKVVEQISPDVVILQLGNRTSYPSLPASLLRNHPGLKVFTLSLDDNLLEVFSKKNILIESADDLISAIEANPGFSSDHKNAET